MLGQRDAFTVLVWLRLWGTKPSELAVVWHNCVKSPTT